VSTRGRDRRRRKQRSIAASFLQDSFTENTTRKVTSFASSGREPRPSKTHTRCGASEKKTGPTNVGPVEGS
jgi:hypothetical protein